MLVVGLGGCSASQVIDLYTADYRETAASAGDQQLLLNILRAKDDLPIHFSDLSIIHASIQSTAGATAGFPLAQNGSTTPTMLSPVIGTQISPTFDLGTMDTQDFTKGILNPVDPQIIKQLFDQGIDPRIIMLLFFSEYDTFRKQRFLNNMACDLSKPDIDIGCKQHIYDYLEKINSLFSTRNASRKGRSKRIFMSH